MQHQVVSKSQLVVAPPQGSQPLPLYTSELKAKPATAVELIQGKFVQPDHSLISQVTSSLSTIKRSIDREFALFSHQLTSVLTNYNLLKFAAKTGEDVSGVLASTLEDEVLLERLKEYPLNEKEFEEAFENCRWELQQAEKQAPSVLQAVCPTGHSLVKRYGEQIQQYFPLAGMGLKSGYKQSQPVFTEVATKNFAEEQYRTIESVLQSAGHKLKHVSLIFRASEHGFRSKNFKELCSKMEKTLVVVKSTMKKIFGGYTPCKWLDTKEKEYIPDKKGESFLFSADEKLVFPIRPHQTDYAISSYGSWGPIFGSPYGPDLSISDQCHLNEHSCSSLGSHYEIPITIKEFSNEAFCLLAGAKKFKVLQYEVFQVEFQ